MSRFWSHVLHPLRFRKNRRAKTPSPDNHAPPETQSSSVSAPPSCLLEFQQYGNDLVRLELLQESRLQSNDAFIKAWNAELFRVCERSREALNELNKSFEDLSYSICVIASPLHNASRSSLQQAQRFISAYLGVCQLSPGRDSGWRQSHLDLKGGNCNQTFEAYFQEFQERVLTVTNKDAHPDLLYCIQLVCRWEYELFLIQHYIDSQMNLLLVAAPNATLKICWDQSYQQCLDALSQLEVKLRTLLEHSMPSRDDFTCAICLSLYDEPLTLPGCLHTFCLSCLKHLCIQSCTASGCTSPHACPLCRAPFRMQDCTSNVSLENFMALYFPSESISDGQGRRQQQRRQKIREYQDVPSFSMSKAMQQLRIGQRDTLRRSRAPRQEQARRSSVIQPDTWGAQHRLLRRTSWWF